jgi:hypothetical protein
MNVIIIELLFKLFSLIPNIKLIKEAQKFISKNKKFIKYIGDNLFSNSKVKEALQNYKPDKKLRHRIPFVSFIGLLSEQTLLEYIFINQLEEVKAFKTIYIHYQNNLKANIKLQVV